MNYRRTLLSSLYIVFFVFTGCASVKPTAEPPPTGIDGVACVGSVEKPPEGVIESSDPALLQKALGASGEGKLCEGKVYQAIQPVTVYRVWNRDKDYTLYGSWWSFAPPEGPRQKYREDNVICPSWSALDRMSTCKIKAGTKIVVGPGQSAECKHMTYAKSATNQVFIPNDSRNNIILVDHCTEGTNWP